MKTVDINLNNPLAVGLVGVGCHGLRGYRFTTKDYICVWSKHPGDQAIEDLNNGIHPLDILPTEIVKYKILSEKFWISTEYVFYT